MVSHNRIFNFSGKGGSIGLLELQIHDVPRLPRGPKGFPQEPQGLPPRAPRAPTAPRAPRVPKAPPTPRPQTKKGERPKTKGQRPKDQRPIPVQKNQPDARACEPRRAAVARSALGAPRAPAASCDSGAPGRRVHGRMYARRAFAQALRGRAR